MGAGQRGQVRYGADFGPAPCDRFVSLIIACPPGGGRVAKIYTGPAVHRFGRSVRIALSRGLLEASSVALIPGLLAGQPANRRLKLFGVHLIFASPLSVRSADFPRLFTDIAKAGGLLAPAVAEG